MATLSDEAKALIAGGSLGHLVSLGPDGSPQVTVVWIAVDGDELVAAHLAEHQKVRNIRREAKDKLRALGKDKKISEDDEKRGEAELQKLTDRFVQRIDELLKKKEQEILEF